VEVVGGSVMVSFATSAGGCSGCSCEEVPTGLPKEPMLLAGCRSLQYILIVSLPSAQDFLTICHAPLAVIASHTEYMSVSVGMSLVLGPAQGEGRGYQQQGRDEGVQR